MVYKIIKEEIFVNCKRISNSYSDLKKINKAVRLL